jgi:hypothetical protein
MRHWLLLLFLAAAAVVFAWRGPMRALGAGDDLRVFYTSTRLWLQGHNPYDYAALGDELFKAGGPHGDFAGESLNPPCTFVVLAPLGLLSWPAARVVWLAVNLLALGLLFLGLLRLVRADMTRTRVLLLMTFTLGLAPVQTSIWVGQTVIPVAALIVWAILAHRHGWDLRAGALFAMAAAIKPQMGAAYLAYLLVRGRWRVVLAGAVVGCLLLAAGVVRLEVAGAQWLPALRANYVASFGGGSGDLTRAEVRYQLLQLQSPLFVLTGVKAVASMISWIVVAILGAIMLGHARRLKTDRQELLALAIVTALGLLPVYHRYYDAVIILIPVAWALASHPQRLARYAKLSMLLVVPFVLPGGSMLNWLGATGHVSPQVVNSWWWQGLVVPHETWLTLGVAIVLTAAIVRTARLPDEESSSKPAASAGSLGDTTGQSC